MANSSNCDLAKTEESEHSIATYEDISCLWCFVAEIPGPEEAFERAELYNLIHRVVDNLPAREAKVIRAYYFDDEPLTALARNTTRTRSMFSHIHIKAKARLIRRITQLLLLCNGHRADASPAVAAADRSISSRSRYPP